MLNLFKDYGRPIRVNGKIYADGKIAWAALQQYTGEVEIELNFIENTKYGRWGEKEREISQPTEQPVPQDDTEYRIKVRQYMCNPEFDFHDKWNNGKPMPMRIMVGKVLKETKGMYLMELRGKPEPSNTCMKCGRKLTNPVSFNYGIGPECGGHFNIAPPSTLAEFKARKEQIREKLEATSQWTGWVIKKAVESKEVVTSGSVRSIN